MNGADRIALRMAPPAPATAEIELRGLLAYSQSPTVSLWDGRVGINAAVAAGSVFVHPLEVSLVLSISLRSDDVFQGFPAESVRLAYERL